jgi:hypothetical protein
LMACGRRFGKSIAAAAECAAALIQPAKETLGWIVAPTRELADIVFGEVDRLLVTHFSQRITMRRPHEQRIVVRNMAGGLSEVRGKTADDPRGLLGKGLDFLVIDEAARLKPDIWQAYLSQTLMDKKGWALFISTPRGKGWFYGLWLRARTDPEYEAWNMPSGTNPLLDPMEIEKERERLPDRFFRQEYLGEFVEGSGEVFQNVRECATGELEEPERGVRYVGGCDLARTQDFSAVVILRAGGKVVSIDRFNRMAWELQESRIIEHARRYNDARIRVDSTGKGEPVFEQLVKGGLNCEPYVFTPRSKAALVDNLSILIERKRLVLPRYEVAPDLIEELEAFEYDETPSGRLRSGAPSGMHDDLVTALALGAWKLAKGAPSGMRIGGRGPGPEGFGVWS